MSEGPLPLGGGLVVLGGLRVWPRGGLWRPVLGDLRFCHCLLCLSQNRASVAKLQDQKAMLTLVLASGCRVQVFKEICSTVLVLAVFSVCHNKA